MGPLNYLSKHYSLTHHLLIHRQVAGMSGITGRSPWVTVEAVETSGNWKESQMEERKGDQGDQGGGGGGDQGSRHGKYGYEKQIHPHPCRL